MAWTDKTWAFQEGVESSEMNQLRDNFRLVGPHLIARKTSDQSVASNSTTLVADTALLWTVAANEVWQYEIMLLAEGQFGILGGFSFPSGRISGLWLSGTDNSTQAQIFSMSTATSNAIMFQQTPQLASPNYHPILITGVFVNGGTPGTVNFGWCQVGSSATVTTVKANSTLWGVKLA